MEPYISWFKQFSTVINAALGVATLTGAIYAAVNYFNSTSYDVKELRMEFSAVKSDVNTVKNDIADLKRVLTEHYLFRDGKK